MVTAIPQHEVLHSNVPAQHWLEGRSVDPWLSGLSAPARARFFQQLADQGAANEFEVLWQGAESCNWALLSARRLLYQAQDAVLTGLDRKEVGAILFPSPACAALSGLPAGTAIEQIVTSEPVQQHMQRVLDELAATATGSATRIARAVMSTRAPSLDLGEVTDKGSINQRAVLKHRDDVVQALYAESMPHVLKPKN